MSTCLPRSWHRTTRPATLSLRKLLLVALLVPAASGLALDYGSEQGIYQEVAPTDDSRTLSFWTTFLSDGDADAYFKVVARGSNPVFNNGSAEEGWWTQIRLSHDGDELAGGETNGATPIELGRLIANETYRLEINVRVPAGALADESEMKLFYLVAVRDERSGGSGGNLDPSLTVQPVVRVFEGAVEAEPKSRWYTPIGPVAIVAVAIAGARRR